MKQPSKRVAFRVAAKNRSDPLRSAAPGRFHDTEPTSYVAETPEVAWLEVAARFGGLSPNPEAFDLWKIGLEGLRLADLTDNELLDQHNVKPKELREIPAPRVCRELATVLRESGFDGAIYESARVRGKRCYVLFLENTEGRLTCELTAEERPGFRTDR